MSAWIEIPLPARGVYFGRVALLVSAWIEIKVIAGYLQKAAGRTPRECVD